MSIVGSFAAGVQPLQRSAHYADAPRSRKGSVRLWRLGLDIPFESTLEERYLRVLDTCPSVINVSRGETTQVMAPDGTVHHYTPDFVVRLDGQVLVVECKPVALLGHILREDLPQWQLRHQLYQLRGQSLRIVTDADLPAQRMAHVTHFAGFWAAPVNEIVRNTAVNFVRERGAVSLAALRDFTLGLLKLRYEDVDGTVYGMIARQEFLADTGEFPPDCVVDVPGRSLPFPDVPSGRPLDHYLIHLPAVTTVPPRRISPELRIEAKLLSTKRGQRYLRLFAACLGDPAQLSVERMTELAQQEELSLRTLQRFKAALECAGGKGSTFTDLSTFLITERVKATNQVSQHVYAVMEDVVSREYFVPPSTGRARNIADLHERVRKICLSRGFSPPSYNAVARHVARFEQRDPVLAALRRDGREAADQLVARHGKYQVQLYGELLAVDCTPCDVFTVSGRLTLRGVTKKERAQDARRGHVVTLVDVATSHVLASTIFDGAISAANILEVLRQVFLGDYQELLDLDVRLVPQVSGLPLRIRMDSGSEFQNRQVSRALGELGIEVLRRNKGTKHYGGVEERTIQSLIHAHHSLAGTSMGNIQARGDYKAQQSAVLTLGELNQFHQLVVEKHNNLVAPMQDLTRFAHAAQLVQEGNSVWRPLSDGQLETVRHRLMPMETRSHLREGIKLLGLVYTSRELANTVPVGQNVNVFYNPDDVSQAEVIVPATGEMITVYAHLKPGLKPPLTLKESREINRRHREAKQAALDATPSLHEIGRRVQEEARAKRQKPIAAKAEGRPRPEDSGLVTITEKKFVIDFDDAPRRNT